MDRVESRRYPYSVCYCWEAWEYCEYEEEDMEEVEDDDPETESGDWDEVLEGSLDDCFDALSHAISWDIEDEAEETGFMNHLRKTYGDDDTQGYINALEKFHADKKADFRRKCLITGLCHRDKRWAIRPAISQSEIDYLNQEENSVEISSHEE